MKIKQQFIEAFPFIMSVMVGFVLGYRWSGELVQWFGQDTVDFLFDIISSVVSITIIIFFVARYVARNRKSNGNAN